MISVIGAGLLTGYAIAVPLGAVATLIVTLSARHGWRTGAAAAWGVACVDGLYAAVAVLAGSAISERLEAIEAELKAASGLALLLIAGIMAFQAWAPESSDRRTTPAWTPARAWLTLAAITAVNPATVVYFSAIVLGGTVALDAAADRAAFLLAVLLASASWQLLLASIGTGLGRALLGTRARRISGLLGAGTVLVLALGSLGLLGSLGSLA